MPTDKQAVTEHIVDEKPVNYRRVTLEMLHRAVEACLQNHPDLQLGGYDGRCFQGLHEGCCVADTAYRPIVDPAVDIIGKLKDDARLKFRYAIGFKELVKIRLDLSKAGYSAVEDVPIGCVCCKRNDKYPAVGTRHRTGVGMLQGWPIPVNLDGGRAAADSGRIRGDEGNIDVPVGMKLPGEPAGIKDQVVTRRRQAVEFNLCTAVNPGNTEDFGINVTGISAFVQQFPHQVGGQVVAIGLIFRKEVVDEVLVANTPSLECNTVLAGSIKKLLDGSRSLNLSAAANAEPGSASCLRPPL